MNRKKKWNTMSKADLIKQLEKLEKENNELKQHDKTKVQNQNKTEKYSDRTDKFDFNKYHTRQIALKVLILAWEQDGIPVEEEILHALRCTHLIQDRDSCRYSSLGCQVEDGVNRLCQIIRLDVRTNLMSGVGVRIRDSGTAFTRRGNKQEELKFCMLLNKVLPAHIRVLAWCPLDLDAEINWENGIYTFKYFFPKSNLNIEAMHEAGNKLLGKRHLSALFKPGVVLTSSEHVCHILSVEMVQTGSGDSYDTVELSITGQGFLPHQVRCILALLFLIGRGKEQPQMVQDLLDSDGKRPPYNLVSELPLLLYDCELPGINWISPQGVQKANITTLQQMWTKFTVQSCLLKSILGRLETTPCGNPPDCCQLVQLQGQHECLLQGQEPPTPKASRTSVPRKKRQHKWKPLNHNVTGSQEEMTRTSLEKLQNGGNLEVDGGMFNSGGQLHPAKEETPVVEAKPEGKPEGGETFGVILFKEEVSEEKLLNETYISLNDQEHNAQEENASKCESAGRNAPVKKGRQNQKSIRNSTGNWIKVDDGDDRPFKCIQCNKKFKHGSDVNAHMRSHTGEKPYFCEKCFRTFKYSSQFNIHKRTHTGEKPHVCNQCGKGFPEKARLMIHLRTHTGDRPYKCEVCPASFKQQSNLRIHMVTHTKVKAHICKVCQKTYSHSASLVKHMRTHTGEKPYQCVYCGKCFMEAGVLTKHVRKHTGEKPHQCTIPECSKMFVTSSELTVHMRSHTGEKPYACSACGKHFSTSSSLNVHLKTHSDVKSFKCEECGKCFKQHTTLYKHRKIHSDEKIVHVCTECGKIFSSQSNLKRHMEIHNKEQELFPVEEAMFAGDLEEQKVFRCDECGKTCTGAISFDKHLNKHTYLNKAFQCGVCDLLFEKSEELFAHMKVHDIQALEEVENNPDAALQETQYVITYTNTPLPPQFVDEK